jgi:dTDP-4-amino-4,6-dideoxygalactose transaminase
MDMPAIMSIAEQHGLVVLEDCAQAHGAHIDGRRVGTFGHAAAFSFYPTKNLGAVGDGGAVTTSDASVAGSVRALRAYGWRDSSRISEQIGYNSRLDELQAAILNVLLPELESGNAERRQMAQRYRAELRGLQESRHVELPDDGDGAVYHQFAIGVDHRDAVREHLLRRGHVMTGIHYSPALHHHPVFRPYAPDSLPVSEDLARRLVSLPIQPEAAAEHVAEIATKIGEAIKACSRS